VCSAEAKPTATLLRCSDDASYLTTGHASLGLPAVKAQTSIHAMLLVEDAAAPAPAKEGAKPALSMLSTARYSAPGPAGAEAPRKLSEVSSEAAPAGNGTKCTVEEGTAACETAEEKLAEVKTQETEQNFALLVAFLGCIFIVRAANKYARDPS
jgi:hypothetical protein